MGRNRIRVIVLMVLGLSLLVAGAWAGEQVESPKREKGTKHEVSATVVSVDKEGHTITFKGPDGEEKTAPVLKRALPGLEEVEPGDKVKLTCRDTPEGEHVGIVAIEAA